jgi:transposase
MRAPTSYPSDLTQAQWEIVSELLPPPSELGRPRSVDMQAVVNAIFYILCAGCAWRMLPKNFPAWQTVYHYFRRWRIDGTWEQLNTKLQRWVRLNEDRHYLPSVAIIDSQSVKYAAPHKQAVGFDGGKKVNGRKRHILVDTLGMVLMVVVTAANYSERQGAIQLLIRLKQCKRLVFEHLITIWTDAGYKGQPFTRLVMDSFRLVLEILERPSKSRQFTLVHKRWVVERTFGWFNHWRRLSKDYEILPETTEAFIYAGMVRLMLRRLA